MNRRRGAAVATAVIVALGSAGGCTLFVDTNGLTSGSDAGPDTSAADAATDAPLDSRADAAPPAWRKDLEAEWTFDETSGTTAHDTSGHGHDATLVGGGTWTTGQVRGAIRLDGIDDYFEVLSASTITLTAAYTIAGWIRSRARVVGYNPNIIGFALSAGNSVYVRVNGDNLQILGLGTYVITSSGITFERWTHVAMTFENRTVRWYLDGKPSGTGSFPELPSRSVTRWYIGQNTDQAQRYNGDLDQLRLFRRALSASEIVDVMSER